MSNVVSFAPRAVPATSNPYTALIAGYEEFYFGLAFQSVFAAFVFFAAWEHWRSKERQQEQ